MKYLSTLLLLVTLLPAEAQSVREDLGAWYSFIKTKAMIEQQKYDSAVIWADAGLAEAEEEFGKREESYVMFLRNLELAYGNVGKEKEMEVIYKAYYEELKIAPTDAELLHNLSLKSFVESMRVIGNDNVDKNLSFMKGADHDNPVMDIFSNPDDDKRSWTKVLALIDLTEEHRKIDATTQKNKKLFENTPIEGDAHTVLDAIDIFKKGKATKEAIDKNKAEKGEEEEEDSGGLASRFGIGKNKKGKEDGTAPEKEEKTRTSSPFGNLASYADMSETQLDSMEMTLLDMFRQEKEARDTTLDIMSDVQYAGVAFMVGNFYEQVDRIQQADTFFAYANEGFHKFIDGMGNLSGNEEQFRAVMDFFSYSNYSNSFVVRHYVDHPSITGLAYNNILLEKGLLLEKSRTMQRAVLASEDDYLLRVYDLWIDSKNLMAANYNIENEAIDMDSVEEANTELKKELSRQTQNENQRQWQAVQQGLSAKEATVEFLHFPYYKQSTYTSNDEDEEITGLSDLYDSLYYVALVLRPEDQYPQMVPLCKEADLKKLLTGDATNLSKQLYRGVGAVNSSISKGDELYALIWEPLEPLLKNINTLYLSPSGLLNQISFAGLPYQEGVLLDRYQLRQVSSTRVLAHRKENVEVAPASAALFGGIQYDFNLEELPVTQPQGASANDDNSFSPDEQQRGNAWNYLLGTLEEVETIGTQLKTQQISYTVYTGKNALEERFKELGNRQTDPPAIIHVATHGFFLADAPEKNPEEEDEEMLNPSEALQRSGLLFAGANHSWQGDHVPQGIDDGILLASEAAQMNLQKTSLVVLSACETGLGEIQGSEGVYGLQRAIREAGAQYLIMSLWQVPDQETVKLMSLFYGNWLGKKQNIQEAFTNAQKTMRANHTPHEWAAFVLIE